MKGEVLKGHLDMLLLAAVAHRPAHGYAILGELKRLSGGTLELFEGTVYPGLHRLELGGLRASRWSVEDGRRRRVYRLTAAGRAALAEQRRDWQRTAAVVTAVLQGKPCPTAS